MSMELHLDPSAPSSAKLENTLRYLGIEVDDAEQIELCGGDRQRRGRFWRNYRSSI